MRHVKIGDTFGMLTVVGAAHSNLTNGSKVFWCKCECGNTTQSTTAVLRAGRKTHCGCRRKFRTKPTTVRAAEKRDPFKEFHSSIVLDGDEFAAFVEDPMEHLWDAREIAVRSGGLNDHS
jgi:hypothetical protein